MDLKDALRVLLRVPADYVDMHLMWQRRHLAQFAPLAHGRLLDVGCGNMPYREVFLPHVQEYVGVEYGDSFKLTDASKRKGGPDVYYDGVTLPFEDETFDSVLNIDVLEHTPEPARLVREIGRVLKNGATLILTAPFSFRLHEEPHDYFRYTLHGLRSLCDAAGLEVARVERYGSLPSVMAHKLNSYLLLEAARLGGLGQMIGKLGHENTRGQRARLWTLPLVGPLAIAAATGARLLDAFPAIDATETLGFMLLAKRRDRQATRRT